MGNLETVTVHKLTMDQLEQRFIKIGRDFKMYKKDWELFTTKDADIFTVYAYNKKRFIGGRRGLSSRRLTELQNKEQCSKLMKIRIIESDGALLLEKDFRYTRTNFILVKIIPNLLYIAFILNTLYWIASYVYHFQVDEWFRSREFMFFVMAAVECSFVWGSENLEEDRLHIIEELLQRLIYD